MKTLILSSLVVLLFAPLTAKADEQIAQIQFAREDFFIKLELPKEDPYSYRFHLCNVVTSRCAPISSCTYKEKALVNQIGRIENADVRRDFQWVFVRGDTSSTNLQKFYPELRGVLLRAAPECSIPTLEEIRLAPGLRAG